LRATSADLEVDLLKAVTGDQNQVVASVVLEMADTSASRELATRLSIELPNRGD
jgi:hypothetical protein